MAVIDDVRKLAELDVVYLTSAPPGIFPQVVYRGRLHQALDGNWVFNTFTGPNGVMGLALGGVGAAWASQETPNQGIIVTIAYPQPGGGSVVVSLLSVLPAEFND
jgi:hypothetical protein